MSRKPSEHDIENEVLREEIKAIFKRTNGVTALEELQKFLKKEKFMSVENVSQSQCEWTVYIPKDPHSNIEESMDISIKVVPIF